jgi:Flp pilus assembly protein TadD
MLVTWPFLMLLLDYWPLGRLSQSTDWKNFVRSIVPLIREKLPLFVLAALSAILTIVAQSHAQAVRSFVDVPVALRICNALVSYAKYLLLTFWPNNLAVYYPFPRTGIPSWQVIGAILLLIAISIFCFFQRKSRPYLVLGWLWFIGTLVPVIGLIQVGGQSMADRYFYVPSVGLFIALVFGLTDLANTWHVAPSLTTVISTAVLLILATLTNAQIQCWRDSFTLFEHTLAVTPPNLHIEYNLGMAMGASGKYDEAAAHFQKSLGIDPNFYDSLVAMGVTRSKEGRLQEGVQYLQTASRLQPNAPTAHMQLGLAFWKEHRDEAALEEMRLASQLAPEDADIRANFALALSLVGRLSDAIEQFHEALRLNPHSAETHNNLGLALMGAGRTGESVPEFEMALQLKPELSGAADNLQRARAQLSSQR